MKRVIVVVLATAFLAGAAFAGDGSNGEINVKTGVQVFQTYDDGMGDGLNPVPGISLGAEYLYPVHEKIKVGAGVGYLFERKIDSDWATKVSGFPLYAIIQTNPIENAQGVFFKGTLGYSILKLKQPGDSWSGKGFSWGLGAGYEFPFGLILEADYTMSYPKFADVLGDDLKVDYGAFGINVGYKFKL
jgi:hypothetical protein